MKRRYWLLKTEPSVFSFEDLLSLPKQTTSWEGVRNYQARNFMRDDFSVGDLCLIYHSNADPTAIFGIAEVVREAYSDPTALDPKSKYFDEKAKGKNPWVMVDIKAISRFKNPITRSELARHYQLKKMMVLKKGCRLSIQPVTQVEFETISQLGGAIKIKL